MIIKMHNNLDSTRAHILVSLLLLCNIYITETKALEKRSVSISVSNPCHINPVSNIIVTPPAEYDVTLTNTQAAHMDKHLVQLFQQINYTATLGISNIRQRRTINDFDFEADYVIEPATMEVNYETRQAYQTNFSAFMVTAEQSLRNLSGHLSNARMHGTLPFQPLLENMKTLGELIDSARCDLHTNFDVDRNGECLLEAEFVNIEGMHNELGRAFVVIRDIQKYATFLIELYQSTNSF